MSRSLSSFLERRNKTSLKASTLLLQVDESCEEEKSDEKSLETEEVTSDHDDEWKVSDDNQYSACAPCPSLGSGLLKIIQATGAQGNQEGTGNSESRVKGQVWGAAKEKGAPQEPENVEEEETSKKWVPKFKASLNHVNDTFNDVDLAESAKLAAAKGMASKSGQKKKKKATPSACSQSNDATDDREYIKVKFNVFDLVGPEYRTFGAASVQVDAEMVTQKYFSLQAI